MTAPQFSFEQKLEAIKRELSYRRHVYERRVANGQMTRALADRQIRIFEEIADDYVKAAATGRLL
jgi:hypothetical protein